MKKNQQKELECPICGTLEIAEETDMTSDYIGYMLCRNGHYFTPKKDLYSLLWICLYNVERLWNKIIGVNNG